MLTLAHQSQHKCFFTAELSWNRLYEHNREPRAQDQCRLPVFNIALLTSYPIAAFANATPVSQSGFQLHMAYAMPRPPKDQYPVSFQYKRWYPKSLLDGRSFFSFHASSYSTSLVQNALTKSLSFAFILLVCIISMTSLGIAGPLSDGKRLPLAKLLLERNVGPSENAPVCKYDGSSCTWPPECCDTFCDYASFVRKVSLHLTDKLY